MKQPASNSKKNSEYALKLFTSIKDDLYISEFLPLIKSSEFDPNLRNHTTEYQQDLLSFAVFYGRYEMSVDLINKGVDINAQDKVYHKTPLHWAASNQSIPMMKVLIEHKADLNIPNKFGYTFWNILSKSSKQDLIAEYAPVFKALEKGDMKTLTNKLNHNKGLVNAIDGESFNTPLHKAALSGNVEAFDLFIKNDADILKKNVNGKTPYDLARENGKFEIIKYYVDHYPEYLKSIGEEIRLPTKKKDLKRSAAVETEADGAMQIQYRTEKSMHNVVVGGSLTMTKRDAPLQKTLEKELDPLSQVAYYDLGKEAMRKELVDIKKNADKAFKSMPDLGVSEKQLPNLSKASSVQKF